MIYHLIMNEALVFFCNRNRSRKYALYERRKDRESEIKEKISKYEKCPPDRTGRQFYDIAELAAVVNRNNKLGIYEWTVV